MFICVIKDSAEAQFEALRKQGVIGDIQVLIDRDTGKKFIAEYEDGGIKPTAKKPSIPTELVEGYTYIGLIYSGFRPEGIYRHNGSELVATTELIGGKGGKSGKGGKASYQAIEITADSLEALDEIYTLVVLQGDLTPEENWEAEKPVALVVNRNSSTLELIESVLRGS